MPILRGQGFPQRKRKKKLQHSTLREGLVTLFYVASFVGSRPIAVGKELIGESSDESSSDGGGGSTSQPSLKRDIIAERKEEEKSLEDDFDYTDNTGGEASKRSQPLEDYTLSADIENRKGDQLERGMEREAGDNQEQWEALQAEWKAGWESTTVDVDSRGISGQKDERKGTGKSSPHYPFANKFDSNLAVTIKEGKKVATRKRPKQPWTEMKTPFYTSEVGKLASQSPLSIGLFNPEYPFTPSGQRRSINVREKVPEHSDLLSRSPFLSGYTVSPSISHSNVMKHGWTESVLDDDVKLSVPDERRQPRDVSADSKILWGKKWFRWKSGEGYVWSRKKDLSAYKHGPGIALSQLLPPRERPFTASLPLIPNDSKRDLVWLLILSITFFALIAFVQEYRGHLRSHRKGKRRNRSSLTGTIRTHNLNGLQLQQRAARAKSLSTSTSIKTRQRIRAQNFRDLCKVALLKGVSGMGMGTSSTNTTIGLANVRWSRTKGGNGDEDEDDKKTKSSHLYNNGISSGYSTSNATKRSASTTHHHSYEDEDGDVTGATIEMLEKGGVDGSNVISPTLDKSHSTFLTNVSTTVFEDPTYSNWNEFNQGKSSQTTSESSGSTSSSSSITHSYHVGTYSPSRQPK